MTVTVPIFESAGQAPAVGVNWLLLSAADSSSPLSIPSWPAVHVPRPSDAPALAATPAGSVSVVPLTADSASIFSLPETVLAWGRWMLTVKPLGVLAACVSGSTAIDGSNGSSPHPVKGDVNVYFEFSGCDFGSCSRVPFSGHVSPVMIDSGVPSQDVGIVRNASGLGTLCGSHFRSSPSESMKIPLSTHSQPRTLSWRASFGAPQKVTALLRMLTASLASSMLASTA